MSFQEILDECGPLVHRIASSFVSGDELEDLEQETLFALFRAFRNFRGESSRKTFAYRVAQNCGLNYLRRRRVHDELTEEIVDNVHPESLTAGKQEYETLAYRVRTLPLPLRQAIVLRLEGCTYDEISNILGIGKSNVGVRVHRAVEALKKMYRENP